MGTSVIVSDKYFLHKRSQKIFDFKIGIERYLAEGSLLHGQHIASVRNRCVECHGQDLGGRRIIDHLGSGVIVSPNISPRKLDRWSNDDIATLLRMGVKPDGTAVVMMPVYETQHLSAQDIASLIIWLRSVPPVTGIEPKISPGPFLTIPFALGVFPAFMPAESGIIRKKKVYQPYLEPQISPTYGSYLARTSCVACHGLTLKGGWIPGLPRNWPKAKDITKTGIGSWSEEEFVATMKSGINPAGIPFKVHGTPEIKKNFYDLELRALYLYLSGVP